MEILKSKRKIKINGHCVNPDDYFAAAGGPTIYIEGDWMKPNMTRHGIMFSGPMESKIKKIRELATFLTEIADILEKGPEAAG